MVVAVFAIVINDDNSEGALSTFCYNYTITFGGGEWWVRCESV